MLAVTTSDQTTRRIVALTSMMPKAITMTTNIKIEWAQDLFATNEVLNLSQLNGRLVNPIGGVSWLVDTRPPMDAMLHVLMLVVSSLKDRFPCLQPWLFVGTSAWQPKTKLVRHYKIWGALRARGIAVPKVVGLEEAVIESDEGLKIFGAGRLLELQIDVAAQILLEESCVYMAALPASVSVQSLLNNGWQGDLLSDFKMVDSLVESNGLLFKRVGEFDDCERGLVSIGRPEVINALRM